LLALIYETSEVVEPRLREVIIDPPTQTAPKSVPIKAWHRGDLDDDKQEVVQAALGSEGMFAVEGKSVIPTPQVGTAVRNDRKNQLKRLMSPIPIIPAKKNIELVGGKATLRINSQFPEFYLRELQPEYDQDSALERTTRQGTAGPEVELIRATVKGNKRVLESIRSLMGEELGRESNTISIQQWEVAKTVYRYTLSAPLPPGEYALAELLPGGLNLFVWDFGVDTNTGNTAQH